MAPARDAQPEEKEIAPAHRLGRRPSLDDHKAGDLDSLVNQKTQPFDGPRLVDRERIMNKARYGPKLPPYTRSIQVPPMCISQPSGPNVSQPALLFWRAIARSFLMFAPYGDR